MPKMPRNFSRRGRQHIQKIVLGEAAELKATCDEWQERYQMLFTAKTQQDIALLSANKKIDELEEELWGLRRFQRMVLDVIHAPSKVRALVKRLKEEVQYAQQ